ncbi:Uncharacterised protein [Mycobacteroides abscessus subsp. massiliense]|uniref:hypothetical protein n=1 Tax=Mycobacteroides abscessus TaxID=36809 RepID=UPI0009A749E2|nr:hypothetical protein [Mycobacteroides abscessus]SKG73812.1 Uncharacterised protein [Mycobacteroides abscessus subsp. massiliense]SKH72676.1 Uncharacterised protein [Mycobacteroides abscessus subsp. massiliense]SKI55639.1 Uncharacterised protein [Mycobacteroides abscessus subsp. massiliense]SKI76533.1 Uncharacterised protein [Mycobacteroides abscessus subsp. massiliense]SKL31813.1 Uncharacterised protein [Mycobacteroides abscessus subsp. massiliense]
MSRLRLFSRTWDRPTKDQHAEHWASLAKTPETRARIRRLSRIENITIWPMVVGGLLLLLMLPVTLGSMIWFWITRTVFPEILFWGFPIATGVVVLGAIPYGIASALLGRAQYADADSAIGVVEGVTSWEERDGEGDLVTVYRVRVTAWPSDELTLHRHLDGGRSDHGGPDETWIGRRIRILHNTVDPDDLYDVRFDGWPDRETKGW